MHYARVLESVLAVQCHAALPQLQGSAGAEGVAEGEGVPVKPKKKITSARKTKATAKKPASKTRSKIAESPPAKNNGEGSDDDIVDMTA